MSNAYKIPKVLPTTVVGSYPKFPEAKKALKLYEKGEISEEEFEQLIKEAIRKAVEDQIEAGIDIISDGEQRREDMEVYFAERLEGFVVGNNPEDWVRIFDNVHYRKPIVVGKIAWKGPMTLTDWKYATEFSQGRPVKAIITGPYTMADWAFDNYYGDKRELIIDLAKALQKELKILYEAGARFLQVDEPALSTHPYKDDIEIAKEALSIVFSGMEDAKKIVHICHGRVEKLFPDILDYPVDQFDLEFVNNNFKLLEAIKEYDYASSGKELGYGVIDIHSKKVETKDFIKNAIYRVLEIMPPEKVYVKPDCGLKILGDRDIAFKKMKVMVEATKEVRKELGYDES
ncbi:methionine synthase [Ignicoccus islandicus]|uniref:methionine synthase n=1 Tax=Ignicoccus islandicus TaxID=54259 RepID=UPI0009463108|nr:methionine synthase [Ignicoccus islandicus]